MSSPNTEAPDTQQVLSKEFCNAVDSNNVIAACSLRNTLLHPNANLDSIFYAMKQSQILCFSLFIRVDRVNSNLTPTKLKAILQFALQHQYFQCVSIIFDEFSHWLIESHTTQILDTQGGLEWLQAQLNSGTLYKRLDIKAQQIAIVCAVKQKHWPAIRFLVEEAKFPLNCDDDKNPIPMIAAVDSEDFDILNYLLNNGADLNGKTSLLAKAVQNGSEPVVYWLLEKGSNQFADALEAALWDCNPTMLLILLKNIPLQTLQQLDEWHLFLSTCIRHNYDCQFLPYQHRKKECFQQNLSCLSLLMDYGLTKGRVQAIQDAIFPEQMKLLLRDSPNLRGTAIVSSYMRDRTLSDSILDGLDLLLQNNTCDIDDFNPKYGPVLPQLLFTFQPTKDGKLLERAMELLLAKKPNLLVQDSTGNTCLHILCNLRIYHSGIEFRFIENLIRSVLIAGGPELLLIKNSWGQTCLDCSANVPEFMTDMICKLKLEMHSNIEQSTNLLRELTGIVTSYCFPQLTK